MSWGDIHHMIKRRQPLVITILCACYALILRLYPTPFRTEFEEEMKGVFAQAISEAAAGGWWALLKTTAGEFSSLPLMVVAEWWSYFRQKERIMGQERLSLVPESAVDGGRTPRLAVLLAALPHILLATSMSLSSVFARVAPSWSGATYYGLLIIMGLALLFAWRQGWPLWSGSWAGYWLFFAYGLAGRLVPWRPGLEYLLMLPPLAIGLLLFLRRPLYGLLAVVAPMLFMTHLFAFELVAGGEWVWSSIWLLLGVTAGAIVWLGSVRAGVLLTVASQLVAGLIISTARSVLPYRGLGPTPMGPRPTPELATLLNDFVPLTLAAITLPLALLLLHPLGQLAGRGGNKGRHSHKVLLLGLAITFGGVFALRARPSLVDGMSSTFASVAVTAGLLLALGAAVTLIRALRSDPNASWQDLLLPLLAAFAPLVIFALPHPFPTAGHYSAGFQAQLVLSYAGVLAWTLLAILTLVRGSGGRAQPDIVMEAVPG